jgi:hypothetical protein
MGQTGLSNGSLCSAVVFTFVCGIGHASTDDKVKHPTTGFFLQIEHPRLLFACHTSIWCFTTGLNTSFYYSFASGMLFQDYHQKHPASIDGLSWQIFKVVVANPSIYANFTFGKLLHYQLFLFDSLQLQRLPPHLASCDSNDGLSSHILKAVVLNPSIYASFMV